MTFKSSDSYPKWPKVADAVIKVHILTRLSLEGSIMPQGMSLHIGLNSVDPNHYAGWSGPLNACEADAEDMAALAKETSFASQTLLTAAATRQSVIAEIRSAADQLRAGDIFFLSYSGHGGQLPDLLGDEPDQQDETWCLYDGELVDDELYAELARIPQGVRVLVLSDSCHSGTVVKTAYYYSKFNITAPAAEAVTVYRVMPDSIALRTYRNNKNFYDPILLNKELDKAQSQITASVLLLSGCQDNQLSADGAFNGLFTGTLLRVWGNGGFRGAYREFHNTIVRRMAPDQTPNYFFIGVPDSTFEGQQPFIV